MVYQALGSYSAFDLLKSDAFSSEKGLAYVSHSALVKIIDYEYGNVHLFFVISLFPTYLLI